MSTGLSTSYNKEGPDIVVQQQVQAAASVQADVTTARGTDFVNSGTHITEQSKLGDQLKDIEKIEATLTDDGGGLNMVDVIGGLAMAADAATGGNITMAKVASGIVMGGIVNGAASSYKNSKNDGYFNDIDGNDDKSFASGVDHTLEEKYPTVVMAPQPEPLHPAGGSFAAQVDGGDLDTQKDDALKHVRTEKNQVLVAKNYQEDRIADVGHVHNEQLAEFDKDLSYEDNIALNPTLQKATMIAPSPMIA